MAAEVVQALRGQVAAVRFEDGAARQAASEKEKALCSALSDAHTCWQTAANHSADLASALADIMAVFKASAVRQAAAEEESAFHSRAIQGTCEKMVPNQPADLAFLGQLRSDVCRLIGRHFVASAPKRSE